MTLTLKLEIRSPHEECPIAPRDLVRLIAEKTREALMDTRKFDDHYPTVDVYEPVSERGITIG